MLCSKKGLRAGAAWGGEMPGLQTDVRLLRRHRTVSGITRLFSPDCVQQAWFGGMVANRMV